MDFERLKRGMAEIVTITDSVPEQFKDKCFDALLSALLNEQSSQVPAPAPPQPKSAPAAETSTQPEPDALTGTLPPIKGQMRVFMQRTGISETTLAKVVSYVEDQVHFLHEPKPTNLATGQIEWALLSALENAIKSNTFIVDGATVRTLCDEKGFLDSKNYWAIFGRNDALFTKPITASDSKQTLSNDGQAELAKLIESLAKQ